MLSYIGNGTTDACQPSVVHGAHVCTARTAENRRVYSPDCVLPRQPVSTVRLYDPFKLLLCTEIDPACTVLSVCWLYVPGPSTDRTLQTALTAYIRQLPL